MSSINDVIVFTEAFGLPQPDEVTMPDMSNDLERLEARHIAGKLSRLAEKAHELAKKHPNNLFFLRMQLMIEELGELAEAMCEEDAVAALDALVDMRYVADGTTITLGLVPYWRPAWDEVHGSNMSKLDKDGKPVKNEAGRVVKGPLYKAPDLNRLFPLSYYMARAKKRGEY